jgi:putative DNA primase/helicase
LNYQEKPKYTAEALKFIDNLSCNDDEVGLLLLQMMGYCFMRHQDHMKYFLLVGEGQNGKSVLAKIISGIFNSNFYKNYTSISMKNLSGNFSLHNLKHKLVNFPTENSGQYVDEDVIKTIVSDDLIDADVKNRERTQFVSYATQIFSSNKLASNKDGTLGGTSRMVVIPMNAEFPRSGWRKEDSDIERVYREDKVGFYESFIPLALEAYEDARVNGFAVPKIVAEATERHIRQSNQVLRWMEENEYNSDNLKGTNGATNITFNNTPQEIYESFRNDMVQSGAKHIYGRGRFYDEIFKHYELGVKLCKINDKVCRMFR